jgi:hypothetical protein
LDIPRFGSRQIRVIGGQSTTNNETQMQSSKTLTQDEESGEVARGKRSVTDSAYQSLVSLSASLTISSGWSIGARAATLDPIVDKDLKCFDDLDPGDDELDHYDDIRLRLKGRVARIIKERHQKSCVVQGMMIGKSTADARLHVAVFCSPQIQIAMHEMFACPAVHQLLRLPGSDRSLGFLVIPEPHSPCFAQVKIDISCPSSYLKNCHTYCGAPAIFRASELNIHNSHRARQGTVGGIVKVTGTDGKTQFYGMSAGHIVSAVQAQERTLPQEENNETDAQAAFDVTAWISEDDTLGGILDSDKLPAVSAGRAEPTHDWVLFDVQDLRPNLATPKGREKSMATLDMMQTRSIVVAKKLDLRNATSDSVLLLGSIGGTREGSFSNLPADIWLEENERFVESYVLRLSGSKGMFSVPIQPLYADANALVRRGDSGAWVVHATKPELYGHVVSTNAFEQAYVLPVVDTFENIRLCLGAESVVLPSTEELSRPVGDTKSREAKARRHIKRPIKPKRRAESVSSRTRFESVASRMKSVRPDRANKWPLEFASRRMFFDQSFVENLRQLKVSLDPLSALLGEPSERLSSQEIRLVKAFCQPSLQPSVERQGRAWVSKTPRVRAHYLERVTAKEFPRRLMQAKSSFGKSQTQHKTM